MLWLVHASEWRSISKRLARDAIQRGVVFVFRLVGLASRSERLLAQMERVRGIAVREVDCRVPDVQQDLAMPADRVRAGDGIEGIAKGISELLYRIGHLSHSLE